MTTTQSIPEIGSTVTVAQRKGITGTVIGLEQWVDGPVAEIDFGKGRVGFNFISQCEIVAD